VNDTSRVLTLVFTDLADSTALKRERGLTADGAENADDRVSLSDSHADLANEIGSPLFIREIRAICGKEVVNA